MSHSCALFFEGTVRSTCSEGKNGTDSDGILSDSRWVGGDFLRRGLEQIKPKVNEKLNDSYWRVSFNGRNPANSAKFFITLLDDVLTRSRLSSPIL